MVRRLPAALLVAMVANPVLVAAWAVAFPIAADRSSHLEVLGLIFRAAWIGDAAMIVAGALALREVTAARWARGLLLAATLVFATHQVIAFGVQAWMENDRGAWTATSVRSWFEVLITVAPFVWTALMVAIAAVGAGRHRPATTAVIALIVALAVMRDQLQSLVGYLSLGATGELPFTISATVLVVVAVLAVAGAGVAERGVGWAPAARGLGRAATAMAFRVALSVVLVPLLILAAEARSIVLVEGIVVGVPIASGVAGVISLVGLAGASRADAEGAPRLRLASAALAVAIGAVFDLLVGLVAWRWRTLWGEGSPLLSAGAGWMAYVIPAIGLAGNLAFLSALDAIAARIPTGVEPNKLALIGAALAGVAFAGVWVLRALGAEHSEGALIIGSLALGAIAVVTTVALVAVTRRVAAALAGTPTVPTAVARGRVGS